MQRAEGSPGEKVYVALLHFPVYDKNGQVVTTCVTNLDLHDIARVARTYGLGRFFVVQSVPTQAALVQRLMHHWLEGFGSTYNARRKAALEVVSLCPTLGDAVDRVSEEWQGRRPELVVTAAGRFAPTLGYSELRKRIHEEDRPILLLFGTGWGLSEEVALEADHVLEPVRGAGSYNHLSVRSAVSIIIDRLLGER